MILKSCCILCNLLPIYLSFLLWRPEGIFNYCTRIVLDSYSCNLLYNLICPVIYITIYAIYNLFKQLQQVLGQSEAILHFIRQLKKYAITTQNKMNRSYVSTEQHSIYTYIEYLSVMCPKEFYFFHFYANYVVFYPNLFLYGRYRRILNTDIFFY